MDEMTVLINEPPESIFACPAMWGPGGKTDRTCEPGSALACHHIRRGVDLGLPGPRTARDNVCCL